MSFHFCVLPWFAFHRVLEWKDFQEAFSSFPVWKCYKHVSYISIICDIFLTTFLKVLKEIISSSHPFQQFMQLEIFLIHKLSLLYCSANLLFFSCRHEKGYPLPEHGILVESHVVPTVLPFSHMKFLNKNDKKKFVQFIVPVAASHNSN